MLALAFPASVCNWLNLSHRGHVYLRSGFKWLEIVMVINSNQTGELRTSARQNIVLRSVCRIQVSDSWRGCGVVCRPRFQPRRRLGGRPPAGPRTHLPPPPRQ